MQLKAYIYQTLTTASLRRGSLILCFLFLFSIKEETRSASPQCPKPDESEEPHGTAMETAGGQAGKSLCCFLFFFYKYEVWWIQQVDLTLKKFTTRGCSVFPSLDGSVKSENIPELVITKEMEEEENQLMEEGERKEKEMMKKVHNFLRKAAHLLLLCMCVQIRVEQLLEIV